jgi:hypothetical protein
MPATSLLSQYTGVTFTNTGNAVLDSTAGGATVAAGTAAAGSVANAVGPTYSIAPASGKNIAANTTAVIAGKLNITPDVAGVYKITVFSDSAGTGSLVAGAKFATWTVTAAGAPATATISAVNSTAAACSTTYSNDANCRGSLVKVTLKDANGYATAPRGAEAVTVTTNSATATPASTSPVTLSSSNVDVNGIYWGNFTNTAAETISVTVAGSGSLLGVAGLSTATALTYKAQTVLGTTLAISDTTGTSATAISGTGDFDSLGSATAITVSTAKSSVSYKVSAAAAGVTSLTIVDSSAVITGDATLTSRSWTVPVTIVSDGATTPTYYGSVTVTAALAADDAYSVVNTSHATNAGVAATLTGATAGVSAALSTVSPTSSLVVVGGTTPITVVVKDAFGYAVPNASVNFTTASTSRNASVSAFAITDANGSASYSLVDASVSTTNLSDVVTVIASYAGAATTITATATLSYKTAITAGTVLVTTPNTTAGVANTVVAPQSIAAGSTGAQATLVSPSAVVTDASGLLLVGAPVVWTVTGPGAGVLSTKVTTYTDATGTATTSVYGWVTGTYTVSATVGGKTGTGTVTFASNTATNARVVSAKAEGAIVTATVVDRFGNPVSGVTLYATKTGSGFFGNGLSSTSGVSNAAGVVEFNVAGGSATVTVSAVDPAAVAGTTYGQTCAAAGKTSCASTATAITAQTVGTALLAETGVGSAFAPAGVASVTVEAAADNSAAAAADAAAEATDAANAATDAANAAAEAADAATAAAQDAADAVAALSTQVSEMVNALKKQITALTNLVIKIQKKVKA